MRRECEEFRERLAALLEGRPDPPRLVELGWHEHLHGCGECRELLEQEEALEELLASLPEPTLPPDLTARVLTRLARRDASLDDLLALDDVPVPHGLASRVRDATEAQLERRLDDALDLAGQVRLPEGLAARVLDALAPVHAEAARSELRAERARARFRWLPNPLSKRLSRSTSHPVAWRVAAAMLVVLGGAVAWRSFGAGSQNRGPGLDGPDGISDRRVADAPEFGDDEIIAALPVLEYWDALHELDPLEQDIVTRLDVTDEALLDAEDS